MPVDTTVHGRDKPSIDLRHYSNELALNPPVAPLVPISNRRKMQFLPRMAADLVLSYQIIPNEWAVRIKQRDRAHAVIEPMRTILNYSKLLTDCLCFGCGTCVGCRLPFIIHRCAG